MPPPDLLAANMVRYDSTDKRALILGGGHIGLTVAQSLRLRGVPVVMVALPDDCAWEMNGLTNTRMDRYHPLQIYQATASPAFDVWVCNVVDRLDYLNEVVVALTRADFPVTIVADPRLSQLSGYFDSGRTWDLSLEAARSVQVVACDRSDPRSQAYASFIDQIVKFMDEPSPARRRRQPDSQWVVHDFGRSRRGHAHSARPAKVPSTGGHWGKIPHIQHCISKGNGNLFVRIAQDNKEWNCLDNLQDGKRGWKRLTNTGGSREGSFRVHAGQLVRASRGPKEETIDFRVRHAEYRAGESVIYNKTGETVTIDKVHHDDPRGPYYTVKLRDGRLVDTEGSYLRKPSGTPAQQLEVKGGKDTRWIPVKKHTRFFIDRKGHVGSG